MGVDWERRKTSEPSSQTGHSSMVFRRVVVGPVE